MEIQENFSNDEGSVTGSFSVSEKGFRIEISEIGYDFPSTLYKGMSKDEMIFFLETCLKFVKTIPEEKESALDRAIKANQHE